MNRRNLNHANTDLSRSAGERRSPWFPAAPGQTVPDTGLPDAPKEQGKERFTPSFGDDEEPSEPAERRNRPAGPLLL